MDYSGLTLTLEDLNAMLQAIDQEIPDRIKAQLRPLEQQLRRNRQEFETFRDGNSRDMEAMRQETQSQLDRQQRSIAGHNQIMSVMLYMLSQLQAPRVQPPRRTRTTDGRGPRANQARAPGNQDAESAIRRQRILSQARFEQDGRVYYRCGVCPKTYQRPEWFIRHLNIHL